MKYLTVIRHAKSAWDQPGLADHDRPLNTRGHAAAPAVGKFLAKTYFGAENGHFIVKKPDLLVTSTAARTVATSDYLQQAFGLKQERIRQDKRLYLAEPKVLLDVVRDLDEESAHAVIVAHNPGIHAFCDEILSRAAIPRMPTCTAVMMSLPHAYWGLVDWHEATLLAYVTPKALERRFPSEYAGISSAGNEDD
jgi:phosphohistidine phosphatase